MKFSSLPLLSILPQLALAAESADSTSTTALLLPSVIPLKLENSAQQRLLLRQSNSAPDSTSWYTLTTLEAGDSNCLFAVLGVDGSVPYPVRFESCNPLKDDALWQFVPDSDGRYFIYNKAWGGTGQRLDINCQTPSMCIMWMGPSDDIYNNQRWFLDQSGATSQISSLGLPGSSMVSMALNGGFVSLMQNTSTSTDNALEWKLVKDTAAVLSSDAPIQTATTPTAALSSGTAATTTTASQPTDSSPKSSTPSTFSTLTTSTSTSPPTSTPSPSSLPTDSTSTPDKHKSSTLSVGDIAGIVSAACAVISILFAIIAPAKVLQCITCGRRPTPRVNNREMRRTMLGFPMNMQTVVNFHAPNRDAAGAAASEGALLA